MIYISIPVIPFITHAVYEVTVYNFTVNKSPSYLTNIKVYTSTIEEEKQSNDLLSYFTPNADQIIILDNADSILKIPYIGKQR